MTSLAGEARRPAPAPRHRALLLGLAAGAALAAYGLLSPAAALHGWLVGFVLAGGAPLGAVALLLIHALTGGGWGETHRPALLALARPAPVLALLVLPLVLGARAAYPWATDPDGAGAGVARLYLNAPAVAVRSLLGLGLLGAIAWRLGRRRPGPLAAGLGLCLYAVFVDAAAYDWLLSLAPRFTSSAFGAQLIAAEILTALCCVVLISRAPAGDRSWADLGGLVFAVLLGESYLILMSVAIHWYGDKPDQAAWYLARVRDGWSWLAAIGTLLGSAVPMTLLLLTRVRRDPPSLRLVAVLVLAGLAAEDVWLVAPGTEAAAALAGPVATLAVGGLLAAAGGALAPREGDGRGA